MTDDELRDLLDDATTGPYRDEHYADQVAALAAEVLKLREKLRECLMLMTWQTSPANQRDAARIRRELGWEDT